MSSDTWGRSSAKPEGRYSGNDDDDSSDVGSGVFSLLSLAAIVHCDPEISKMLVAHGADPHDIDPVLANMNAAIINDDPVAYEQAWKACSHVRYCEGPGWSSAPLHLGGWGATGTEDGWVDTAIMARAWRVVSAQLAWATPKERDNLLSAAPTYYPDKPKLATLLRSMGAKADGSSWGARPREAPFAWDMADK